MYPYWTAIPATLNQALYPSLLPWFSRAFVWSSPSLFTAPDSGLMSFSADPKCTLHSWLKLLLKLSQSLKPNGKHRNPPSCKGFKLLRLSSAINIGSTIHNLCFRAKFLNHGTTYKSRKNCRLQLGQIWVDFHRSGKRHISSTKVALYQISKYALKNWQDNIYITGHHFLLIQAN